MPHKTPHPSSATSPVGVGRRPVAGFATQTRSAAQDGQILSCFSSYRVVAYRLPFPDVPKPIHDTFAEVGYATTPRGRTHKVKPVVPPSYLHPKKMTATAMNNEVKYAGTPTTPRCSVDPNDARTLNGTGDLQRTPTPIIHNLFPISIRTIASPPVDLCAVPALPCIHSSPHVGIT